MVTSSAPDFASLSDFAFPLYSFLIVLESSIGVKTPFQSHPTLPAYTYFTFSRKLQLKFDCFIVVSSWVSRYSSLMSPSTSSAHLAMSYNISFYMRMLGWLIGLKVAGHFKSCCHGRWGAMLAVCERFCWMSSQLPSKSRCKDTIRTGAFVHFQCLSSPLSNS